MKKITLFIFLLAVSIGYSQTIPVTFDSDITVGDNWKADSGLASVAVVNLSTDSPDHGNAGEINSSSTGQVYQNAQLRMITNYLDLTTATGSKIITLDVYSNAAQDFLLKIESTLSGAAVTTEKGFSHPGTGWETIAVDFNTPRAGHPIPDDQFKLLVVFPGFDLVANDFKPAFDSTTYIDDVTGTIGDAITTAATGPTADAPTPPARAAADYISIFSNAYTNVSGTNFNPNWGQSGFAAANTANEIVPASGNLSLYYPNFNYQGNQFGSTQNISAMEFLHVDIWVDGTFNPNVFVISSGGEISHPITNSSPGTWISIDIPVAGITGDTSSAIQFKFDGGNGSSDGIYVDNLYFWKTPTVAGTDASLSALEVDGSPLPGFATGIMDYTVDLSYETTVVPQITTATPTDANVTSVTINQAPALPGDATVVVVSQDGSVTETYTVSFVLIGPTSAAPTPPNRLAADVISLYSNSYTNNTIETWSAVWDDSSYEDVVLFGNDTKKINFTNFIGVEFVNNRIDASGMTYFHMDFWTDNPDLTGKVFNSKFSQWGGGTSEVSAMELNINGGTTPALATGAWVSIDVEIATNFSNNLTRDDLAQFIITSNLGVVYVDNIYFHKNTTLSTNEFNLGEVKAYPNPTSNDWNISSTQNINTVELYDVLGKKVMSLSPNTKVVTLSSSSLNSGLYFAKLRSDSGAKTIKLVKE